MRVTFFFLPVLGGFQITTQNRGIIHQKPPLWYASPGNGTRRIAVPGCNLAKKAAPEKGSKSLENLENP